MEPAPFFQQINLAEWPRRPYFEHYFNAVRCTYSITADIDISTMLPQCAKAGVKFQPAMVHCISSAVNRLPEMRTCFDGNNRLGTWDFMSPCYAVFHNDDKTFSNLWTPFCSDFSGFHSRFLADVRDYGDEKDFFPKPDMPENCFTISTLPWIDFTAFNINVFGKGDYLRPIFTLGRYTRENGRVRIPLAVQVHHAVCDGYHVGQLFEHIRTLATESASWIRG